MTELIANDTIARQVFGLLFEASTEGVFVVERASDRVVSANVRTEEMLSREVGSLIGVSLADLLFEPRDLRAPGYYEDVALRGSDDYPVYTELNVIHVELPGHGALAAFTARDTSERRSLQRELVAKHSALIAAHQELAQRNQEIALLAWRATMGELVAGIAHHLNNPVGALASTLRRLERASAALPDAARGELDPLLARADRITRRIEASVAAIVEASRATTRRTPRPPHAITGELPPELAAALATFTAQLEDLPTRDLPTKDSP
ncbi:MAG TPA: hypothetical protein VFP84_32165 [Kofleriaceae bacterium]|nr:hypothetical protein [Kofleriaceae bacterium]